MSTRSALGIKSVSVSQPIDMLDLFKQIAAEREAKSGRKIPISELYNEAVVAFIEDVKRDNERGVKTHFAATPAQGNIRRTVWLEANTMAEVKHIHETKFYNLASVVLTALLRFFSKRGITFENFPEV
jgi:hypothetical protein